MKDTGTNYLNGNDGKSIRNAAGRHVSRDATTFISPGRTGETNFIHSSEDAAQPPAATNLQGVAFDEIDWGEQDEEIVNAFNDSAGNGGSIDRAGIATPVDRTDDTTSIQRDAQTAASEPADGSAGDQTASMPTAALAAEASSAEKAAKPRSKTLLIVGAVVVIALVIAIFAFVLPGTQQGASNASADVSYAVECIDANTGDAIADAVKESAKDGETITVEAPSIDGYKLARGTLTKDGEVLVDEEELSSIEIPLEADADQKATFSYAKLVGYTVNYVDSDGNAIADSKTVGDALAGSTVTETAPAFDGYELSSDVEVALKLGNKSEENIISFVYAETSSSASETAWTATAVTYVSPNADASSQNDNTENDHDKSGGEGTGGEGGEGGGNGGEGGEGGGGNGGEGGGGNGGEGGEGGGGGGNGGGEPAPEVGIVIEGEKAANN